MFDLIFKLAFGLIGAMALFAAWSLLTADSLNLNERSIQMCYLQGGVPIVDRDGRIEHCDFPLTLRRR